MTRLNANLNNKIGQKVALFSFIIGSLLFISQFFISNEDTLLNLFFSGYLYLIVAVIINCIVLLVLIINASLDKENRVSLLKTAGLMLLNIPIAFAYTYASVFIINFQS